MRHPDYLVTINENVQIETIEHLVSGEPMKVPTCSYVNRENTYKIVKDFIENKEVSALVKWIELYDIDFQHEF